MSSHPRLSRPSGPVSRRTPACAVESFESRVLLAIDVAVGTGAAARVVTFTDGDGTAAVIRVTGGAATLTFDATDVSQTTANGLANVTGTNVQWTNVIITGNNPSVTVSAAGGNGTVSLSGMSAAGPVNAFSGRGVILGGTTTLSNGIGKVELAGLEYAAVTINRSGQARLQDAALTILGVRDASITSQQPLRMLRVGSWTATNPGQPNQVTTPRINVLQSGGDFVADLSLSGNGQAVGAPVLGNVKVLGALALGEWNVGGKVSRIAAGSVADNWEGTFGDVASFAVTNDLAGDVTANSINALSANTITGADIDLTGASAGRPKLNRLAARGAITGTEVRSSGDIGTVSAASISDSTIYAGVSQDVDDDLPAAPAAFVGQATIRNVTIRSAAATPAFIDSNIAASTLGRMNLGTVQVANGGEVFGLAAGTIQSLSAVGANGTPIRESRLTEPADTIDQGDFEIRVF